MAKASLYDISVKTLEGKELSMSSFKGKTLLIVNTATGCGYTPQLEGLQKLNDTYSSKGLQVLGFPSNEFRQESREGDEIKKFCKLNYGVNFPQFKKDYVNGDRAQAVYKYLFSQEIFKGQEIGWNFEKILVSKDGKVIKKYSSRVKPMGGELENDIVKLLGK